MPPAVRHTWLLNTADTDFAVMVVVRLPEVSLGECRKHPLDLLDSLVKLFLFILNTAMWRMLEGVLPRNGWRRGINEWADNVMYITTVQVTLSQLLSGQTDLLEFYLVNKLAEQAIMSTDPHLLW